MMATQVYDVAGAIEVGATLMYDDPSDGAAVDFGAVGAAVATQRYDEGSATFMDESAGDTTQILSLAYPSQAGVSPEAPFGGSLSLLGLSYMLTDANMFSLIHCVL
jgi:hypothetical protein